MGPHEPLLPNEKATYWRSDVYLSHSKMSSPIIACRSLDRTRPYYSKLPGARYMHISDSEASELNCQNQESS